MTLVVAAIDADQAVMVADTKITFADREICEPWDQGVYETALPKVVILDRNLVVGYAGADPTSQLRRLIGLRGLGVREVLEILPRFTEAEFVVLHRSGESRLWQVRGQGAEERTLGRVAWAGDEEAWETYLENFRAMQAISSDLAFLAQSSIQSFAMSMRHPSVGGLITRIDYHASGFQYTASPETILISTPPLELLTCYGCGETWGAIGHYFPNARWGLLFPHESPWSPSVLHAGSVVGFVLAAAEVGQDIQTPAATGLADIT